MMVKLSVQSAAILFLANLSISFSPSRKREPPVYEISRLAHPMKIDANWNKEAWRKVKEIAITNYMGDIPAFQPVAKVKMMYDAAHVYVIFKVDDRFVRLQTERFNGKVFEDACVEFFFAPDSSNRLNYFNLEMNAGGTALMGYHAGKRETMLTPGDFEEVEVAHSLPKTLEQEITEPVTWTVEYKLPLAVIKKFSNVTQPQTGTVWRANFFKTSSRNSNPHYITWSFVDNPTPQFHLPQFFGQLKFK